MRGFGRWIHLRLIENPIWYYIHFHLFQLLWFELFIQSSFLFHWVASISGLYSEHTLPVSYCWLRLFARVFVCALDVGWIKLDECPFSFPVLVNFISPAFMCRIICLFDWYNLLLLILLRLIVDWSIRWLWTCFANGDHLMSLFIIKIDQHFVVINWFWWISRLWMELPIGDSYKFSYD